MNFRNRTRPQWTGKVFGWGVLLWTLLLGGGVVAYQLAQQQETARLGVEIARISFEKDLLFRRWGASHGGVYVPITPQTPPNPYLEHVPERDLTTPAGRSLTLVNPAYMVRQLFELQQEQIGLRGHITSLNPLRAENAPDPWEAAALRSFEAGETEAVLVTTIGEEPYLRLMRPLLTEAACLKCHAAQGYELGDQRGGLSVAVPLAPLQAAGRQETLRVLGGYGLAWFGGVGLMLVAGRQLRRQEAGRLAAEDELRRSEQRLRLHIERTPLGFVEFDAQDRIVGWNDSAGRIFGYPSQEILGKRYELLVPGDERDKVAQIFSRLREPRCEAIPHVNYNLTRDGRTILCEWINTPLQTPDGQFIGVSTLVEDVTERARLQELILQAEKMTSIAGLAAGMAHEINNPLGTIAQSAQNVVRRLSPDLEANQRAAAAAGLDFGALRRYLAGRQIDQFLNHIQAAVSRAAQIVTTMLQFSRQHPGEPRLIAPEDLVDQALELATNDYDLKKKYNFRKIAIDRDYQPGLPQLAVTVVEIEQVILNLLKNAAQALAANGPERPPQIALRLRREEAWIVLEVADNGPGMSEEVRQRAFDPFFTTKEPGVGTGLGLWVSYLFITSHHRGTVTVASAPGKGACFTVRLPLAEAGS